MSEILRIVVMGSVDHGKSTLLGRMLADSGMVPERNLAELQHQCFLQGKAFEYAYLLDHFQEERDGNITMDVTQAHLYDNGQKYLFIDCPGHREYLSNAITGACQASAAILVVDVTHGMERQTYCHTQILSLLNVRDIVILINKMDLVCFNEAKFVEVKEHIFSELANMKIHAEDVIPVTGASGDNLINRSVSMPWYTGSTVVEAMRAINPPETLDTLPLRIQIQDVYQRNGEEIVAGHVVSGRAGVGTKVEIWPLRKRATIASLKGPIEEENKTSAGQSIGLRLSPVPDVARGQVVADITNPPTLASRILGRIFWIGKQPLLRGQEVRIQLGTQESSAIVEAIASRDSPDRVGCRHSVSSLLYESETADVLFLCKPSLVYDCYKTIPPNGRIVILVEEQIAGGGVIV